MRNELKNAEPIGSSRNASPKASSEGVPGSHTGGSLVISSERLRELEISQKMGKPANSAAATMIKRARQPPQPAPEGPVRAHQSFMSRLSSSTPPTATTTPTSSTIVMAAARPAAP